jgi:hypothetical protein
MSVAGLALAATQGGGSPIAAAAPVSAASALGAFRSEPASPSLLAEQASLRSAVVTPEDSTLPLGQANFSLARSSSVPGSAATVWIVPSGEDVCTIIVKPNAKIAPGGWSAGCVTVAQIENGEGVTETTSPNGVTIVADVIADHRSGATIVGADGNKTSLPPTANVASAVLSRADSVESPQGPVSLTP